MVSSMLFAHSTGNRYALVHDGVILMDLLLPYTDVAFQIDGTRHIFLSVITRLSCGFLGDSELIDRANAMLKELDIHFQKDRSLVK